MAHFILAEFGVKLGSIQKLNWFFFTNNESETERLKYELVNSLKRITFFTEYSLAVYKGSIILTTKGFKFTIGNITRFSKYLYDIANKCKCKYELWEIEVNPSDTDQK